MATRLGRSVVSDVDGDGGVFGHELAEHVEHEGGMEAAVGVDEVPSRCSLPKPDREFRALLGEPNVDLTLDVAPFFRSSEPADEVVELVGCGGWVLEPGEEVEGLAELTTMMQSPSDRRQVVQTDCDVMGALLEDGAALVLCQLPPRVALADRDQGSVGGRWPPEAFLTLDWCDALRPSSSAGGQLVPSPSSRLTTNEACVRRRYRSTYRMVPFVRSAFAARPQDDLDTFETEAHRHPLFEISYPD